MLRIDILIIGNGCARRSTTQGLLTVLAAVMPDFVRSNRESSNRTGLPFAPAARSYFDNDGPDLLGVYAPSLLDIMPMVGWIQLFFGISLLLNAPAIWHRFRLWRIDANRVRAEASSCCSGPGSPWARSPRWPPWRRTRRSGPRGNRRGGGSTRRAVRAVPAAVHVDGGADGAGDGVALPGSAVRRPAVRAQVLPQWARPPAVVDISLSGTQR